MPGCRGNTSEAGLLHRLGSESLAAHFSLAQTPTVACRENGTAFGGFGPFRGLRLEGELEMIIASPGAFHHSALRTPLDRAARTNERRRTAQGFRLKDPPSLSTAPRLIL